MSQSNKTPGCEIAVEVLALVAVVIALLAWLVPFHPVGPSPVRLGTPQTNQELPSPTPVMVTVVVIATTAVPQQLPTATRVPPTPVPPTQLPPTQPQPTITQPAPQIRDYERISLQQVGTPEESNLGLKAGTNNLLGIPFDTGWTVTTQCADRSSLPTVIQISTAIRQPINIYLLIQAGWGMQEFAGKELGAVSLGFSSGKQRVPLIMGVNIRDWSRNKSEAVSTATSPTLREAWRGTAPDGTTIGGMDMLTVGISSEYRQATLTSMQIADTSTTTAGSQDPCIHLLAITVEHFR